MCTTIIDLNGDVTRKSVQVIVGWNHKEETPRKLPTNKEFQYSMTFDSGEPHMMRKQDGFSLVELLVTLVIFTFVIAAATRMFIPLVNQFKQQSSISETNIEGIVGLELLRTDLDHAGFGLPWYFPDDTINYSEATVAPANGITNNIARNDAPGNPPRAVVAGDNLSFTGTVNGNANITEIVHGLILVLIIW